MSFGFAYTSSPKTGPQELLADKKALLINTTLPDEKGYQAFGVQEAMKKIIDDLRISWCGISNVEHVFLYGPVRVNPATREKYLKQIYQLGKGLSY
jgi:putative NADPH-quinone reductase